MKHTLNLSFGFLLITALSFPVKGQLSVNNIYSDHMVLQRSVPITIKGDADPESTITVKLNDISVSSKSNSEGKWTVSLPSQEAGGPYEVSVSDSNEKIVFKDVYVGDVWVCSGQSNMEWPLNLSDGAEEASMTANDPLIRHFKVTRSHSETPEEDILPGKWEVANGETVGNFTAVGYFFAQELRDHTGVPIGLLNSSWGGSRIEAWMSAQTLKLEDASAAIDHYIEIQRQNYESQIREMKNRFPDLTGSDQGMEDENPIWSKPAIDETSWVSMETPGLWEEQGYEDFDGIGWYRIHVTLEEKVEVEEVTLSLGKIDDSDQVWVNGHNVGGMSMAWDQQRLYAFPGNVLRQGDNIIAIRVEDTGGGGGIYGEPENMFLQVGTNKINLAGAHLFRPGALLPFAPNSRVNHAPTLLYNKMIHPILDFPIKGVIWYQGESNAGNKADAEAYADQFKDMISDWRGEWKMGDFPFLYVQLANFMRAPMEPGESNWAELRASQSAALELPNVGEAVIIDIGEANDIHPRNKKDVGYRLSLEARKIAYGEGIISQGPRPIHHLVEDGKVIITFDQHLVVKDKYGYVKGLDIEKSGGGFQWTQAKVDENKLIIQYLDIAKIQSIRYGWADNPDDVNLYNKQNLPASPFKINILK